MKKFEYLIDELGPLDLKTLNFYGKRGWELVKYDPIYRGLNIFKREIENNNIKILREGEEK